MESFFENLERGLLFITIILIIGFAIFIVLSVVTGASEQVKSSATNLRFGDKIPSIGMAFLTFPVEQETPLILAAHKQAYGNPG